MYVLVVINEGWMDDFASQGHLAISQIFLLSRLEGRGTATGACSG